MRTLGFADRLVPDVGTEPDFLDIVERFGGTGYWQINLKTGVVFFSESVCLAHDMPPGYRPESVEECTNWYHPEDREFVTLAVESAAAEGKPFSYQARIISAKKTLRWIEVSGEVRVNEDGEPATIIGTMKDISETHRMHQQRSDALREAKSASRLKDTFLANMSHELRTPLNAIIGFSQVIQMMERHGKVDGQVGGYATDIAEAGSHLLSIIEEIFSLAQLEAAAEMTVLSSVNVEDLMNNVRSLTGTKARSYGRSVDFDCGACAQTSIVADSEKVTKVLVNLVSNALKFSPADTPIQVTAGVGDCGRVILSVIDEGPGIPEHLHEKIFERFERMEACKNAIEGIGVGLAIARDLVKSMDGEIGVDSVEGEGATFWLAFQMEDTLQQAMAG